MDQQVSVKNPTSINQTESTAKDWNTERMESQPKAGTKTHMLTLYD